MVHGGIYHSMYIWCMVTYVYMVHGDICIYGAWWHIISIQYIWCMVTYVYMVHGGICIIIMVVIFYPIGPAIY